MKGNKKQPVDAAKQFINKHYPNCQGAILAGSVVRGEATDTSDLDIVVFDKLIASAYRESLQDFGWAIEVFVHNWESYKQYFESDRKRARPSLPKMVFEGVILKDNGSLEFIKKEAESILQSGPDKWSDETIRIKRYFITDALDDFKGCLNRAEEIFIANTLAELVSEFVLRTNQQWIGTSKWIVRALKQYDEVFAIQFVTTFDCYYRTGDKEPIIQLVEEVLQPFGGPLFHGFSLGK
ncbi:MAG: nucleotidyltransferase domain-containing protein [Solibacillus sp.]|uniref:nucleotidyltransferase domain-containing protein n=1 Tax=Solibacillus sp. TaxID=1909654 RepID=UPI003314CCE3